MKIEFWTDGSCHNQGVTHPTAMGAGVVVAVEGDYVLDFASHVGMGTNNQAELWAIREALACVKKEARLQHTFILYTDSVYAIGQSTNRHRTNLNVDLVRVIRELVATYPNLTFIHVRGHADCEGNKIADRLANQGRDVKKAGDRKMVVSTTTEKFKEYGHLFELEPHEASIGTSSGSSGSAV